MPGKIIGCKRGDKIVLLIGGSDGVPPERVEINIGKITGGGSTNGRVRTQINGSRERVKIIKEGTDAADVGIIPLQSATKVA